MNKLTILIPTHAIKTEVIGPWKDMPQRNMSAPGTSLIETVVNNISDHLSKSFDLQYIIGVDHKTDSDLSCQYVENLRKIKNIQVTTVDSVSAHNPYTTVTATQNFCNLVQQCHDSDVFMMWEHDWVFTKYINTEHLHEMIQLPTHPIIRFNQRKNQSFPPHETLWYQTYPNRKSYVRTDLFSNNPFICHKKVWDDIVYPIAKNIPTHWGEYGAFIEGPITKLRDESRNQFLSMFEILMYGEYNDESSIAHLNGQTWKGN